jgi:hypothetical protein
MKNHVIDKYKQQTWESFDLDRLAVPYKQRGGGRTTSDLVQMLSKQEFSKNDIIIFYKYENDKKHFMKMINEVAIKMGFDFEMINSNTCKTENGTINFIGTHCLGNTFSLDFDKYYISPVTHELTDHRTILSEC